MGNIEKNCLQGLKSKKPRPQGAFPFKVKEKRPVDEVVLSFQTLQTAFFNIKIT